MHLCKGKLSVDERNCYLILVFHYINSVIVGHWWIFYLLRYNGTKWFPPARSFSVKKILG